MTINHIVQYELIGHDIIGVCLVVKGTMKSDHLLRKFIKHKSNKLCYRQIFYCKPAILNSILLF